MPDASELASYARLLRLTPVEAPGLAEPQSVASPHERPAGGQRRRLRGVASFLLLALLPSILACVYFWFMAADRYVSETRFVLRTPGRSNTTAAVANALQNVAASRTNDDGYIVREFLESRDAMEWLEKNSHLRAAYDKSKWDIVWRFPNPFVSNSEEGLYRHYQEMMSTTFDSGTGVNSLKVQAFTPADAQRIAAELLNAAEALVNRLNERAHRDALRHSEAETDRARQRTLAAQAALTAFRERERLVDPSQATLAVLETIAKLSQDAAQISVQLGELARSSPNGPQVAPLLRRRAAVENQIGIERQRLAGDAQSIAPKIAEYERLMLEREFAEKALIAAMTARELARVEADRQQVYLERVAAPSAPDYPTYPWRVVWCLGILAAGAMAWHMWRIMAANARHHTEP